MTMRSRIVAGVALLFLVALAQGAHAKGDSTKVVMQPAGGDGDQTAGEPDTGNHPRGFPFPIDLWDFEDGAAGWTLSDGTENSTTDGHQQDLGSVPGSRGNGFGNGLGAASVNGFVGLVEWTGRVGGGACGLTACFPGYGNDLSQLFFKSYVVPPMGGSMRFHYRIDAEPGYDFTRVIVSRAGCPALTPTGAYALPGGTASLDTVATFTGFAEGVQTIPLTPYAGQPVCIIFLSSSDGAFSDEDCGYDSRDGLWECDSLVVGPDITTWDAGANGWTFGRVAGAGAVGGVQALSSLPLSDLCPASCTLSGNVFVMSDPSVPGYHPAGQFGGIVSPVIDLTTAPSYPAAGYALRFDVYADLPAAEGIYYFWRVRYSPAETPDCACSDPASWSSWLDNGLVSASATPQCLAAQTYDISHLVPAHAQKLQVAIGVVNDPLRAHLSAGGNASPYIDNVGVFASPVAAPHVVMQPWEYLQDAYPAAATFAAAKTTPAPIDQALNLTAPLARTRLGDSLTCSIARSCAPGTDAAEVDILFRVTPGPCINTAHPWWIAYQAQPRIASGPYAGFVAARADTCCPPGIDTIAVLTPTRTFQSTFHESPPAPGTRYGGLGNWGAYTGGFGSVAIFPDDFFTPGTHIEYVLHSTYIPALPNGDFYLPDSLGNRDRERAGALLGTMHWATQGGTYTGAEAFVNEVSVLPSTTKDGAPSGMNCAAAVPSHCFLYVDRSDGRGPQYDIENAFRNLRIAWDRYDVGASALGMGNDPGARVDPPNASAHNPGPHPSLLAAVYHAILWNTGTLAEGNVSYGSTDNAGDALTVLDGWLRSGGGGRFLWVSGTGNAAFLNQSGARLTFLENTLGATATVARYGDLNPSWGVSLTGHAAACTIGESYGLADNACPGRESYAVLAVSPNADGVATPNLRYPDSGGPRYAAIQNVVSTPSLFRTQLDAWSLDQLRQSGVTEGHETNETIAEWAAVALSRCESLCFDSLSFVGVPEGAPDASSPPATVDVALRGGSVRIAYSTARAVRASLRVYDARGRLVTTLADGPLDAGAHAILWDARGAESGLYFVVLHPAPGTAVTRRLVLLR